MQFGQRVREIRESRGYTQRDMTDLLHVSVSYISKVENERLHFGDYPSEKFVHKLAVALETDEDELLLLSDRVPAELRHRIRERPEAFKEFAKLDDVAMNSILAMFKSSRKSKSKPG